ncbi:hypothetical protein PtrV1_14051 [Pyrenophora tritici-repentis]|nr:hypothetical protein PtrV1_14051 [Pyrenophora tritici-repentis]
MSTKNAQGMDAATQTKLPEKDERKRQPGEGEWAQTWAPSSPRTDQSRQDGRAARFSVY